MKNISKQWKRHIAMLAFVLAGCLALIGCGEVDGSTEARDASFADNLEETGATTENSQTLSNEEAGVLDLVNEASFETLDDDVGLDVRAAENIVDYREGDDGQEGTSDDRTFESFEELDDIAWVGPYAFEQLLSYAKDNGYVEEDDDVHGIKSDSPEADGILAVANNADFVELDEDVALDVRAAENIVEYRVGPDQTPDTEDDETIETLGELDQIAWVGPHAFDQILDYAIETGEVADQTPTIHGIEVGSDEAHGVVEVANEASLDTLDEDVGLDVRAAQNIVDYRQDTTIASLKELDGISWVSERAFGKLLDYAKDNNFVPAEDWRSTLGTGNVDVTIEVTSGTCSEKSCITTYNERDDDYRWSCNRYDRSIEDESDRLEKIKITGQNPGGLTAEYTDDGETYTDSISSNGSFKLNFEGDSTYGDPKNVEGFRGQLNRDYSHQVDYSHYDGDTYPSAYGSYEETTCSMTYEVVSN
ncbi:MAG: hypothetical protein ACOCV2_10675 [Persicimonas sp.]